MPRHVLLLVAFGVAVVVGRADQPVINEAIGRYADAVEAINSELAKVRNADSAKKAIEKLVQLDKAVGKQRTAWKEREKTEPPGGAVLKHANRLTDELEIAWSRVVDNGNPADVLDKLPSSRKVIADRAAWRRPGLLEIAAGATDAKKDLAKVRAMTLTTAAQVYEIKNGKLPDSLQQLVKPPDGTKRYLNGEDLIDPWGLPYQYDAIGPHNKGEKPDIWSVGPDANDAKGRIGIWLPKANKNK